MSAARVLREPDPESAARTSAALLAGAVNEALSTRGAAHLALSGGSTPRRCYQLLGPLVGDWRAAQVWFCDERCVPPDDPQSNFRLAREELTAPGATWHRMQGQLGPDAGAAAYERELADVVLDAALLGIGDDGHTASLFPRHVELDAPGRVVGVTGAPKPPPGRISLTLPALGGARALVLLVSGHEKAPALAAALGEPSRDVPASLLARDHLTVVATTDALPAS